MNGGGSPDRAGPAHPATGGSAPRRAWIEADWPAPPGVHALVTLRHGAGASMVPFDRFNLGNARGPEGDDATVVAANRAELVDRADLPSAPHWLRQVHGTGVLRVDAPLPPGNATAERGRMADEPEADAAVTRAPGAVLAVLTADCLPVVFAARDGSEVACAHAGWRGLAGGVLEATLSAMQVPAAGVVAWLGPAAGPRAYEVGDEVRDAFLDAMRDAQAPQGRAASAGEAGPAADAAHAAAAFVPTRPGHWHVDLYALARIRLQAAGVAAADIHGGGACTLSERRFFSHRRDARTGRMATLVWRD